MFLSEEGDKELPSRLGSTRSFSFPHRAGGEEILLLGLQDRPELLAGDDR